MTRQPSSTPLTTVVATVVLLATAGYMAWSQQAAPAGGPAATTMAAPAPSVAPAPEVAETPARTLAPAAADSARAPRSRGVAAGPVLRDQQIHDEQGRLVYEGDIDLGPVFARIAAGTRDSHRNDGTVFGNREGRLPRAPRGYYIEWVVRTDGLRGVGPQRLITGEKGEAFYTPDHYETFVSVPRPR